jgi:hypothetical protein
VTPRPHAHRNVRRLESVSSHGVRGTALVAAAVVFLTGSPSPGPAAPELHSLGSSAGQSNVLTIDRPSRVALGDVLVAALAVRTSTGAISHSSGWTLIRRDMSGNVGAE